LVSHAAHVLTSGCVDAPTLQLVDGSGGDDGGVVKPKAMSRLEKELSSLAPWGWDPHKVKHPPGSRALRDFTEVMVDPMMFSKWAKPMAASSKSPSKVRAPAGCRLGHHCPCGDCAQP
jgi:hypothetical protein